MPYDELDHLFHVLQERTGLPHPTREEMTAVLNLAGVVAHNFLRPGAPLACYAAGLAIGSTSDPAEREERLRALVAEIEAVAADNGAAGGGDG